MANEPASPDQPTAKEPSTAVEEHPEARGFGQRRGRLHWELGVVVALAILLPLGAVWGARRAAASIASWLPPGMDESLGRPTWEALQVSGQRCADPAAQRYVEEIAAPLLAELGATPFRFRFLVVNDPDVNAFALPGGYVVVNSGLLAAAETGEELAGVLGHELSHVTLRHSTERLAGSLGTTVALALLFGFVDVGAPAYTLSYLAGLHYEREQELAADDTGRELLAKAGISPLGMATFFERLSNSLAPPELLSTHPDPGNRALRARRAAEGFTPRRVLPPPPKVQCG